MISALFIFFASLFSAVGEILNPNHFNTSIFKGLPPCFWDRRVSAECTTKYFGYPLDAWLVSECLMIISVLFAIVLYVPIYNPVVDFFLYAGVWIMNYDTFFKNLLRKRN
jgi:hypothetical protein